MNDKQLTKIYIVRHGETEWNVLRKMQGHSDIPLNALGEEQAKNLAQELKDIKLDLAFSSDLMRAKRTAEIVALEHRLEVQTTELLRERNSGDFEGQSYEVLDTYNKLLDKLSDQERYSYKIPPERESDEELINRIIPFMRETAITHPDKTILMATHGGVIKTLLIHLGVGNYKTLRAHAIDNAAYVVLETDGVDFFVKKLKGITILPENK
jgi:broad specificity phosphatase PhoE